MSDAGLVVIAAAVMKKAIAEVDGVARETWRGNLEPGDRKAVYLDTPDGRVRVGSVVATDPQKETARRVTDPAAFLAWVKTNRPNEIVTTEHVRESFQAALLSQPEADKNGEVIDNPPGVEWVETQGQSVIQVKPTDDARLALAAAIAAGTVSLEDVLALPVGESA